jgi:hypothetical protein
MVVEAYLMDFILRSLDLDCSFPLETLKCQYLPYLSRREFSTCCLVVSLGAGMVLAFRFLVLREDWV